MMQQLQHYIDTKGAVEVLPFKGYDTTSTMERCLMAITVVQSLQGDRQPCLLDITFLILFLC